MKIFIYSDLHISKTSSILPLVSSNDKYTYRQNMIIELGEYLADIIDEEQPDLIINLGDTFDQHTISSYDINVASEFFKCFRLIDIPHIVLVGNHEMINYDFNAVELLSNIPNITVIAEPKVVDGEFLKFIYGKSDNIDNDTRLALMPYMDYKDILKLPEGTFLFSHLDIAGIKIRDNIELENGVEINKLTDYKLVFNGHIHKPSIKSNVVSVGSVTSHSFSDDNNSVPQCYIFDTNTLDLKTYKPTICPLFRKIDIADNVSELKQYINQLDKAYKYVLQVTCSFDIKDEVKEILQQSTLILAHRLNIKVSTQKLDNPNTKNMELLPNIDIKKSFSDFLNTVELKYPKSMYDKILEEVT